MASRARWRLRHRGLLATFVICVLLPVLAAGGYLWGIAANQYGSTVGFAVRTEQMRSSLDILGGLSALAGGASSSSDMDILYKFIQSQEMVAAVDRRVDLRALWSPPYPHDPVFGLDPKVRIEGLTDYWNRMVDLAYDPATGLMEITVRAFTAADAQRIANALFDESARRINALSDIAREDATRYARTELETAKTRLKSTREAMTAFRMKSRIVDPKADIQGKMGLLNSLQAQMAQALIDLDLLRENTKAGDLRITQAERRIALIRKRMEEERDRFSATGKGPSGESYATLVASFERLAADQDFAERAYTSALAAYDMALSQAQQQSRYLAAYIRPTLADDPEYPRRSMLLNMLSAFLLLGWAVATLIFYSVRDRR
ncbi:sugar transporter [Acidimangrovimonas sediminis]|uniref:sugar transporter n=1 Tax=Acidimangrovimonas sediminis TaxID=2056283 RepID=UPI000C805FD9|nr:sugar transporter [Acidimangrovimonas sediminis]